MIGGRLLRSALRTMVRWLRPLARWWRMKSARQISEKVVLVIFISAPAFTMVSVSTGKSNRPAADFSAAKSPAIRASKV